MTLNDDGLMAQALGAVENPDEGKEAAKFITAAPKVQVSAEEVKRQEAMKKLEQARKAKAEAELKARRELEEKKAKAQELKAKKEEEERLAKEQELKSAREIEAKRQQAEELKKKQAEELKKRQEEELQKAKNKELEEQERERKRIEQEIINKKKEEASIGSDSLTHFPNESIKNSISNGQMNSSVFSVENIDKILRVTDMYRDFDQSVKESVKSFYKVNDENKVISKVLTEKSETRKALESLIFAQEAAQVDRAFYLVSLDANQLGTMGYILMNYTGTEIELKEISRRRIEYCRQIERIISEMSIPQQNNLQAIQELLTEPTK